MRKQKYVLHCCTPANSTLLLCWSWWRASHLGAHMRNDHAQRVLHAAQRPHPQPDRVLVAGQLLATRLLAKRLAQQHHQLAHAADLAAELADAGLLRGRRRRRHLQLLLQARYLRVRLLLALPRVPHLGGHIAVLERPAPAGTCRTQSHVSRHAFAAASDPQASPLPLLLAHSLASCASRAASASCCSVVACCSCS